jgi:hypothetical protein
MKLVKFQEVSRDEIEKEAFDIQTNNGRALLLQDLLQSADSIFNGLRPSEDLVFLREVGGNVVRFEVVSQQVAS